MLPLAARAGCTAIRATTTMPRNAARRMRIQFVARRPLPAGYGQELGGLRANVGGHDAACSQLDLANDDERAVCELDLIPWRGNLGQPHRVAVRLPVDGDPNHGGR